MKPTRATLATSCASTASGARMTLTARKTASPISRMLPRSLAERYDGHQRAPRPLVIYPVSQILRAAASVSPRHREGSRSLRTPAQRWWFATAPP